MGIGTGFAPSSLNASMCAGLPVVRIFRPLTSAGVLIGCLELVIWRQPLSQKARPLRPSGSSLARICHADRAVEHLVRVLRILEQIRNVEDADQRLEAGEVAGAGDGHVDGAAAHAGDRRLERAQLAVGEDLEVERAVGLGLQHFAHPWSRPGTACRRAGLRTRTGTMSSAPARRRRTPASTPARTSDLKTPCCFVIASSPSLCMSGYAWIRLAKRIAAVRGQCTDRDVEPPAPAPEKVLE